jgi:hypothetical protein
MAAPLLRTLVELYTEIAFRNPLPAFLYSLKHELSSGFVRLERRFSSTVKVRVGVCQGSVTESNCVTVRWGGEQLEVNNQSVG